MFVRLNSFEELQGVRVKGVCKRTGRKISGTPVVYIDSSNLTTISDSFDFYKKVIFEYRGDLEKLKAFSFNTLETKIIFVVSWVDVETLRKIVNVVPHFVDVVVDCSTTNDPPTYRDMIALCAYDSRIRFKGRLMLNNGEVRVGYCGEQFLSSKATQYPIQNGQKGLFEEYKLEALDSVEFSGFKTQKIITAKTTKPKEPKSPKEPKEKKEVKQPKKKYDLSILGF